MEENSTNVAEAERLLRISEKLLQGRDCNGSRDFAILAQEADPFLDGTDQILAVADVMIASEKRINNHRDWYAVLQLDRCSDDIDLIKKQYRRLALLLHPDKNKFPFADAAFRLVADSWAVLSDPRRKSLYDNELSMLGKVDLVGSRSDGGFQQQKLPVRRGGGNGGGGGDDDDVEEVTSSSFWTVCPYCYNLYEYARVYEDCCLRCQNCQRAFHGVTIPTLPPLVAGREAYHCCWSFFPVPSAIANSQGAKKAAVTVTDRQPQPRSMFSNAGPGGMSGGGSDGFVDFSQGNDQAQKKRGRPRKNVHPW
ncbi:hypothetical protein RHSIM_Rhsim06G0072000 [Rhododendron simsii]|uniref:J domain-containing protein n=1 Tax=Rhododendron simsii TaxID=118357 RepID=A0A834LN01_RHOSS|nr:hypothetical protein RHSIM_Rhsim06G0072000 [Rhododendron simsii]